VKPGQNMVRGALSVVSYLWLIGLLTWGFGIERLAAQQVSIKLFDARPTFDTGPETSPAEAIPFASTSLRLNFAPGDTAMISSTPDGTGFIVIDNFMTINSVNVCEGGSCTCTVRIINTGLSRAACPS
jgi:hypothetical protein